MVTNIIKKDEKGKESIKETKIYIGEKEIQLRFTMTIWLRMEKEICILDDLYTMMHSEERFNENKLPALISMMSGDAVTPKEVLREADPATMKALIDNISLVITSALSMREKKYDDGSVHDEVLEEIEKKETKAE